MNITKKKRLRQSTQSIWLDVESRDDFEVCSIDIEVSASSQRQQQQSPKEEWVNSDGNNDRLIKVPTGTNCNTLCFVLYYIIIIITKPKQTFKININ